MRVIKNDYIPLYFKRGDHQSMIMNLRVKPM